ncbi:hypothetical protein [Bacillus nitroreducens]
MKKEQQGQTVKQEEFSDQPLSGCLTFTSDELFWKELHTVVNDGAEMAKE